MSLKLSGPVSAGLALLPISSAAGFVAVLGAPSLWTPLLVNAIIQGVGYLHSAINHTERWYDACGSLGFIAITLTSLACSDQESWRSWINSALVVIWAARLGRHLVSRIQKDSHDKRFDSMRDSALKLALPWSMQTLWVTLVPSAVLLLNTKHHIEEPIGYRDVCGWLIWLLGFMLEAIADEQKKEFRSHDENRDKFIQTGLWSRSRVWKLLTFILFIYCILILTLTLFNCFCIT